MHGDTAYQSARRAWSLLTHLLPRLREYLKDPSAPEDQGREWPELVGEIDTVLERLQDASDLLTAGPDAEPPPPELVELLREAEDVATSVQVHTFVKKVRNPEADLMDIRRAINDAEPSSNASD